MNNTFKKLVQDFATKVSPNDLQFTHRFLENHNQHFVLVFNKFDGWSYTDMNDLEKAVATLMEILSYTYNQYANSMHLPYNLADEEFGKLVKAYYKNIYMKLKRQQYAQ